MWNKITNFFTGKNQAQNNSNYQGQEQQQQYYDNANTYSQQSQEPYNKNRNVNQNSGGVRLLREVSKDKKVVAVIVTFCSGASYDHLFTSVEQKTEEGTQVVVYSCHSSAVKQIYEGFNKQSQNQVIKTMIKYIRQVDPDCVVFNWECSSGYSSQSFTQGNKSVFQFAKLMIDRGHMTMFSDFSLKALVAQWDTKLFGPNPFVKVAQHSGNFVLQFDCNKLKQCPSAQLQIIGDMAVQGRCNVNAMGGTIVYGVDAKKSQTDMYKLEVLTVVTSLKQDEKYHCQINGKKGLAGHILLTYKSGGHILTSMGHWAELMKIDTSEKVLFEVAARQYGAEKAQSMQMQWANLSTESEKRQYVSKNAVQFVQNQAPCANMSKKARMKY